MMINNVAFLLLFIIIAVVVQGCWHELTENSKAHAPNFSASAVASFSLTLSLSLFLLPLVSSYYVLLSQRLLVV